MGAKLVRVDRARRRRRRARVVQVDREGAGEGKVNMGRQGKVSIGKQGKVQETELRHVTVGRVELYKDDHYAICSVKILCVKTYCKS